MQSFGIYALKFMVYNFIYYVNWILKIINNCRKLIAFLLFIFLIFFSITLSFAQTNTWDGSSSANWNTAANWSLNHVPLATEDVVIPDGITATITINTAAVCSTFTMADGNSNNTVAISGVNSLTATNGITIGIATATKNKILDVAAGTLTCASITFTGSTAANRASRLTLSTGTVNVSGNITMGSTFDELTFSGAGSINVGGTISGGTFTASTGTVNYNGATQTVGAYAYNNLSLSGSGSKVLSGISSITNNFSTSGTANAIAASSLTIGGSVTLGSGSTFTGGSYTHYVAGNWTNNGGTFNSTGSTIDFNGTAAQSIGGSSSTTFNNLTLSGSGAGATTTFAVSLTMNGNLDISSGSKANLGIITTHTANSLSLAQVGQVAGTWGGTGSGATNINTTYFAAATGQLTTVAFGPTTYYSRQTGNWNASTTWSTVAYGNATNTGTFPAAGDIVNIGGAGGVDYTITVAVAAACGSITFQSNTGHSPVLAISLSITLNVSGLIDIPRQNPGDVNTLAVGAGILNAGSISFTNGGTGAAAERRHTLTISTGTVTVSGDVTQSGSTGSATITFTSAGLMRIGGTFLNSSECTFTSSTGTMEYNGAAQSVSDVIYNNLKLSGSGNKTVASALTIGGDITLGGGTTFSSGAFTNTLSGNWINNGAAYSGSGSTINLNGTAQSIGGSSSTSFNNLILGGSGTKTFNISTTINATFSINTGVVANLNSITTHTAKTLSLGGSGQIPGTWGGDGFRRNQHKCNFFFCNFGNSNCH